jgi:hypothetical protein
MCVARAMCVHNKIYFCHISITVLLKLIMSSIKNNINDKKHKRRAKNKKNKVRKKKDTVNVVDVGEINVNCVSTIVDAIKNHTNFKNIFAGDKILWCDDDANANEFRNEAFCVEVFVNYLVKNYDNLNGKINKDDYDDTKIIGIIKIDDISKNYIYIIQNKKVDNESIFLSIDKTIPLFWYAFTSINDLIESIDSIYNKFNNREYQNDFDKKIRAFMGTEIMLDLCIDDIENHIIYNKYSEGLIWGSNWLDHPFRDIYKNQFDEIDRYQNVMMTAQAMKQLDQNTHHVNVRTKFSKSIITIENHDGAFIVNIEYNPMTHINSKNMINNVNEQICRQYPNDVPIDVILTILNFPFVTHTGLLELRPLSEYNFMISALITNTPTMYNELLKKMEDIIENDTDENVVELTTSYITNFRNNKILDEIMHDSEINEIICGLDLSSGLDYTGVDTIRKNIAEIIKKRVVSMKVLDVVEVREITANYIINIMNEYLDSILLNVEDDISKSE